MDTPELAAGRRKRWVKTLVERFWEKVDKSPGHGPWGDCWLWTGGQKGIGWNAYGSIRVNGKTVGAHRLAWEIHNGCPVPDGLLVLHTCDTPLCVRGDHLFTGTHADNIADAIAKGRFAFPAPKVAPEARARGVGHGMSRTDDATVKSIRREHEEGATIKSLADKHGLGWSTVDKIVKRKTWQHVKDEA